MALDNPDFEAALKIRYFKGEMLQHTMLKNNPLLGLMPKDESLGGRFMHTPIISVGNRKRSATYATARAGTQDTETVAFQVGYVNNFQFARWTDDVMRDSRSKGENAILEAVETEMDGALSNMTNDLGQGCFGNVGGSKGTIAVSGLSTTLLTLGNKEDAIQFDIGDKIALSANDGTAVGHALRDSGDVVTLIGVDYDTGVLTGDATWTTQITGAADGDFLFFEGDFKLKASGLAGWIPEVTPTSTAFFTVDRSTHPQRLAGYRFNAGGLLPQDIVSRMAAHGRRINRGQNPTHFIVNDETWADYESSMQNKTMITIPATGNDGKKIASIGYEAMRISTPGGAVMLVADPNCPTHLGYLLKMDSWKAGSVGKLSSLIKVAGSHIQRGTADDWFTEMKTRWNIACKAPWQNGVALLEQQAV